MAEMVWIFVFGAASFCAGMANGISLCKLNHHTMTVNKCTRPTPHVCRVNGPCNGWPR